MRGRLAAHLAETLPGTLVVFVALLLATLLVAGCGNGSSVGVTTSSTPASTSVVTTTVGTTPIDPPTTVAPSISTTIPPPSSTSTSTTTTTTTTTLALVELKRGDEGEAVEMLQSRLTELKFFREEVDGVFGPRTAAAVVAFHKYTESERSDTWTIADWVFLDDLPSASLPERIEADRIELDLGRQLGFVIFNDEIEAILPVSSGNGAWYTSASGNAARARTPRGDFEIYKHYEGWRISYLGGLYRPWYFRGGYAIHGSNSVPAYPASHGCVRVPNWDADWLADQLRIGLSVHVWD